MCRLTYLNKIILLIVPLLRDVLAVENPPRAAAVKVDEAKGVALGPVSSNQEGANRFLVDRRTPELGTAP